MHFDTSIAPPQASALLESRTLYPRRAAQCLQFFYKMTGDPKDRLVVWLKMDDGTGVVRKMRKVHTFYGTEPEGTVVMSPSTGQIIHRTDYHSIEVVAGL